MPVGRHLRQKKSRETFQPGKPPGEQTVLRQSSSDAVISLEGQEGGSQARLPYKHRNLRKEQHTPQDNTKHDMVAEFLLWLLRERAVGYLTRAHSAAPLPTANATKRQLQEAEIQKHNGKKKKKKGNVLRGGGLCRSTYSVPSPVQSPSSKLQPILRACHYPVLFSSASVRAPIRDPSESAPRLQQHNLNSKTFCGRGSRPLHSLRFDLIRRL